jgi:peptide deformylase
MPDFKNRFFYKKLKLLETPSKQLTRRARHFDYELYDAPALSLKMIDMMFWEAGSGLSANQLGIDAQIFVMKRSNGALVTAINPRIISKSDKSLTEIEGCLSCPDLLLAVPRPEFIEVEYYDEKQKKIIDFFYDYDARGFLHGIDHLAGKMFVEKVSDFELWRAEEWPRARLDNIAINTSNNMRMYNGNKLKS